MTVPVGGLRARLIRESLYRMIHQALVDLDWFNSARHHAPVHFNSGPVRDIEAVALNTAALADFDSDDVEQEMGSNLTEMSWRFYVDMFGESEALSLHFCRDIRDILQGRMASIGRTSNWFPVYNYQNATPPHLFDCEITGVMIDRPNSFVRPDEKFWYTVRFDVLDNYTDESG